MTPAVLMCMLIVILPPDTLYSGTKVYDENVNFQNYVTAVIKGLPTGPSFINKTDYFPTLLDEYDDFSEICEFVDEIILD
jgi:hypothetical protein